VFSQHPELFGAVTKDDFFDVYSVCCTKVIGWGMPSPMLVPLVDLVTHSSTKEARFELTRLGNTMVAISSKKCEIKP
jgi:hypothetical protein